MAELIESVDVRTWAMLSVVFAIIAVICNCIVIGIRLAGRDGSGEEDDDEQTD